MIDALNNYIIILKDKNETIRPSGLIVPDLSQDDFTYPYTGVVVSVGENIKDYKKGDHVIFNDMCYSSLIYDDNDELNVVLTENDIIAIIK